MDELLRLVKAKVPEAKARLAFQTQTLYEFYTPTRRWLCFCIDGEYLSLDGPKTLKAAAKECVEALTGN